MENLVQRFDAKEAPVPWEHPRPTEESVARINRHFGIVLPPGLVQLAQSSKYFSACFLSLGPDYSSHSHIIRVNSHWRRRRPRRRIPENLVIFTEGYMDDIFWCLDTSSSAGDKEYEIQHWCPDEITWSGNQEPVLRYPSFTAYIEGHIKWRQYRQIAA